MDAETVRSNAVRRSAGYDYDAWFRGNPAAGLALDALALGEPEEGQVQALLAIAFEIRQAARR